MKKVWFIGNLLFVFLLISINTEAFNTELTILKQPAFSNKCVSPGDTTKIPNQNPKNNRPQSPAPPLPGTCDVADVRAKLIAGGCIELLEMNSPCSLYFIDTVKLTGADAQAYAEQFGANLISVQSKAENDSLGKALLKQGFGGVIWIGFTDAAKEGDFVWSDGSSIPYTNWASGEPNNFNPNIPGPENCTQIYPDGTWNDLSCTLKSRSVIEVNLCPVTTIAATKSTICLGDTTTLNSKTILGAPDYTYSWTSDPPGFTSTIQSPVVSPTLTTTYSVSVTDRYKCVSIEDITITVNPLTATITPSGPITFCQGDSVVLTAGKAASYKWSTGATTQSITVKTSAVYTVEVTDAPCKKTTQVTVTVIPKPVAAFKNNTVCMGDPTVFTDQSVGAIVWGWDFGDNTPYVLTQNPKHTYTKAGVYKVRLGVVGLGNCVDTIQQLVTVHDTPVVSFFNVNNCSKDSIYFRNTTTADPATNITNYVYDFGDGKTGSMPDMGHLYTKGGTYKVTLKATTADGCVSSAVNAVVIDDSPVAAALGIQNMCASDTAKFTNKSVIANGKMTYYWDFGDGSPVDSIISNPSHVYAAGTYTVTLAIVSDKGCGDTLRQPIEIYPAVKADFSAADVCLHEPVVFKNLSTGPVVTYAWNFNDNTTGSDMDPTHTYALPKTYNVSLTVESAKSCKSVIIRKVVVHELPVAKFSAPNVCDGKNVVFKDLSTVASPSIIASWAWDFGDGSAIATVTSPQHLYAAVNKYTVLLKVVTNFGCIDSITKPVSVNANPVVDFTAKDTAGCQPLKTTFTNQSTISAGTILKYLWEFGSVNSKSDLKDPPPYTFKNTSNTVPIKYTIKLTATSDSGCVTTASKPNYITVFPKPLASFSLNPREALVTNPIIAFTNLSIGADSCEWSFDSIGASNVFNPPPYSFVDTGVYKVTLIASNTYGCADTTYREVIIEPDYVIYIPAAFTPNGDEINDTFGAKGSFIMDYEMSIFDRWGNVMYETKDINLPWNGGIKGTSVLAEEAVYVYIIKIKGTNKRNYFYKGAVTVVR